jgi:DNA-binding HxlR family transcriptional regulator
VLQILNKGLGVMPVSKKIIELEGQRGTLQIMLVLQQNGEILYGNLYNNKSLVQISNNSTAKRALTLLLKHGLIVQRPFEGKKVLYYRLSKKGEQFALLINEMESLLE